MNLFNGEAAVSSSSCATERLLQRSLAMLESENPAHMRLFQDSLGPLAVALSVDDERLRLAASHGVVSITHDAHGDVHVRTTLRLISPLIRGAVTVLEAIREGHLEIHGKSPMLHDAAKAFEVFLHGLLRCPSAIHLMTDLDLATNAEAT